MAHTHTHTHTRTTVGRQADFFLFLFFYPGLAGELNYVFSSASCFCFVILWFLVINSKTDRQTDKSQSLFSQLKRIIFAENHVLSFDGLICSSSLLSIVALPCLQSFLVHIFLRSPALLRWKKCVSFYLLESHSFHKMTLYLDLLLPHFTQ